MSTTAKKTKVRKPKSSSSSKPKKASAKPTRKAVLPPPPPRRTSALPAPSINYSIPASSSRVVETAKVKKARKSRAKYTPEERKVLKRQQLDDRWHNRNHFAGAVQGLQEEQVWLNRVVHGGQPYYKEHKHPPHGFIEPGRVGAVPRGPHGPIIKPRTFVETVHDGQVYLVPRRRKPKTSSP